MSPVPTECGATTTSSREPSAATSVTMALDSEVSTGITSPPAAATWRTDCAPGAMAVK
jgi:hypothetical protein